MIGPTTSFSSLNSNSSNSSYFYPTPATNSVDINYESFFKPAQDYSSSAFSQMKFSTNYSDFFTLSKKPVIDETICQAKPG